MNLDALERLEAGELFEVQDHDHPEFPFYVSFDDEIANEYDDAIDRLVDELTDLPDVAHTVREDREVVLVGGSIDRTALEAWLAEWWRSKLLQRPSSEGAIAHPRPPADPAASGPGDDQGRSAGGSERQLARLICRDPTTARNRSFSVDRLMLGRRPGRHVTFGDKWRCSAVARWQSMERVG